jgi:subtilisin family serine protease
MRARFRLGSFCGLAGGAAVAAVVVVEVAVAAAAAGAGAAAAAAGFFLGRPAFFRSTSTHWSAFPISTHFLHGRPLLQKQ